MYDGYDAVVFDLDGTLVRLAVDWDAVATETAAVLAGGGLAADDLSLWEMLDAADEVGLREEVEAVVATHERDGAIRSERLPGADDLATLGRPAAVCSLNSEAAVRAALDRHDLADATGAVVGRDTVPTRKPDPEPVLAALRPLGVPPDRALFVGDSERDAAAAERAGVDFRYVGDGPSGH
jgi:phosphoglycolate phosphatase